MKKSLNLSKVVGYEMDYGLKECCERVVYSWLYLYCISTKDMAVVIGEIWELTKMSFAIMRRLLVRVCGGDVGRCD